MLRRFFEEPYLKVKVPYKVGDTTILHRVGVRKFWKGKTPTAEDLLGQMYCPFQLELMMSHITLKPFQFPVGLGEMVSAPELVREPFSVESVCEAMGADPQYVRREMAKVSGHVQELRVELSNGKGVGNK